MVDDDDNDDNDQVKAKSDWLRTHLLVIVFKAFEW